MKKFSEKDIRKLELLSTAAALLEAVLCVVYLLDLPGDGRLLQFLLAFGGILHLIVALADLMRQSFWRMIFSLWAFLMCTAVFFYLL